MAILGAISSNFTKGFLNGQNLMGKFRTSLDPLLGRLATVWINRPRSSFGQDRMLNRQKSRTVGCGCRMPTVLETEHHKSTKGSSWACFCVVVWRKTIHCLILTQGSAQEQPWCEAVPDSSEGAAPVFYVVDSFHSCASSVTKAVTWARHGILCQVYVSGSSKISPDTLCRDSSFS